MAEHWADMRAVRRAHDLDKTTAKHSEQLSDDLLVDRMVVRTVDLSADCSDIVMVERLAGRWVSLLVAQKVGQLESQ